MDGSDLLSGIAAIAQHLSITPRQAKHRIATCALPIFRMGRTICARKSTLTAWMAEQETLAASVRQGKYRGHSLNE
ncbi:DNA-binding protein [Xanthobacter sp. DSM 24535]|uniref:DNA-binding protein n=1 Tax=Roseixanthobacter psychrophilus TaxID=3119917 RepID=UPI00372813CE